jgi:hypothetical protein
MSHLIPIPDDDDANNNNSSPMTTTGNTGTAPLIPLLTVREILSYTPDPSDEFWSGGILTAGDAAAIVGAPGVGKSRLVLQAAIETILGKRFMGHIETNGPGTTWLFMQTENTRRRLHHDISRMTSQLSEGEIATINSCLRIMDVDALDFASIDLSEGSVSRLRIEETIAEVRPDVVVFDPLRDASCGDLNKDDKMADVCKNIGAVVRKGNPRRIPLIIHHGRTGKEESRRVAGDDAGSFGRNSKVLNGFVRSQINVAAAGVDWPGVIVVGCGKCSNGPKWEPFAAALDEDTMMYQVEESFDIREWEDGAGSRPAAASPPMIADVIRRSGMNMERKEIQKAMKPHAGRDAVNRLTDEAVSLGLIERVEERRGNAKPKISFRVAP